jgi:hypothetical protein
LLSLASVTLKVERTADGPTTILRLIGRVRSEHLEELRAQIDGLGLPVGLDLAEVSLVDVDVVRFLIAAEHGDVEIRRCPPFIREWIAREQGGQTRRVI